jgi:hypothetical protein
MRLPPEAVTLAPVSELRSYTVKGQTRREAGTQSLRVPFLEETAGLPKGGCYRSHLPILA